METSSSRVLAALRLRLEDLAKRPGLATPYAAHVLQDADTDRLTLRAYLGCVVPGSLNELHEEACIDAVRAWAVALGGQLYLSGPHRNGGESYRVLTARAALPTGDLLDVWVDIAISRRTTERLSSL